MQEISEIEKLKKENDLLRQEVENLKLKSPQKYKLSLGELLDRLSIIQLKECKIPEHKKEYAQEISEILEDIDQSIKSNNVVFDAEMLRDLVILAQYNNHIWINESEARKGNANGANLYLSHSLNSIRCTARNKIQGKIGGRKDYKVDVATPYPEWIPSKYS
jgi:hypothetical protein